MQTISHALENIFRAAFTELGLSEDTPILLVAATRPEFGDYQINGVMAAAKKLKINPRELAPQIIEKTKGKLHGVTSNAKLDIAGPGFINIILDATNLANYISGLNFNNKYGVDYLGHKSERVVVDLSSPNLAKEMHVGHLRSTVIGDALARMFEYVGDSVTSQNHVGDWGTQFGMLIAYLLEHGAQIENGKITAIIGEDIGNVSRVGQSLAIKDLEQFYQKAKRKFDEDRGFADKAREFVVRLQRRDNELYSYWYVFRKESLSHCKEVYNKLHLKVDLTSDKYVCGESFYETRLPGIIETLESKGLIEESDGAKCIFFAPNELPGGETTPYIVQKKDGGYLYATTDLAAVDYRVHELGAQRIVYVVDARQSFHFKQLFIVAKKSGFAGSDTKLEHSAFGTMMNEDGKPFKTRDGGTVKLIDLINEAIVRARIVVNERNPDWSDENQHKLAEVMAVDAIKYSDLSKNRNSDYIFSFDKMLAFDGNTAPYLLYAYTRIQSLLNKTATIEYKESIIILAQTIEHKLALHLAKFADMLDIATRECYPHYVCHYLYDLAGLFMQFYEACPIMKAEAHNIQQSRLRLACLTGEILKTGLSELLGIEIVNEM